MISDFIGADAVRNEITAQATAAIHFHPDVDTIFEIGGQDSKWITRLETDGRVRDFGMNDRCAAGSGRFLEVVAARLRIDLRGLSELGRESAHPALISSMCVVFAETEIIGLMAQGASPSDIAAGVQNAIPSRVGALAGRSFRQPVCFTGGVALQPGKVRALEAALSCPIRVSPLPQYTGSLPLATTQEILEAITATLRVGGTFRTFQYVHAFGLAAAEAFRRDTSARLGAEPVSSLVARNLPPAFVLTWRRAA